MRNLLTFTVLGLGAVLLVLTITGGVQAQSRVTNQQEVDTLIERIKAARAREEDRATSEEKGKGVEPTAPGERKPKTTEEKKEGTKEPAGKKEKPEAAPFIKDPNDFLKSQTAIPRTGARDVLGPYGAGTSPEQLLDRIRSSRSTEADEEKAKREKTEKEGITREPKPLDLRNPNAATQSAPSRRFRMPAGDLSNTIGGESLVAPKQAPTGIAEMRKNSGTPGMPDPVNDPNGYEKFLKEDVGGGASLPRYADTNLLRTYEADRFKNYLENERDVRIEPGRMDLSQIYQTYRQFQSMPPPNTSLGRRDAYIPDSTNFLTPTYRGSIYETPYSSDPFRRNYSLDTTQSKYGSRGYYDLSTRDAFSDYYQREYGVNKNFVPTSPSRQYEVNTIKQWTNDLRYNYGLDVRPGDMSYGDLYRLRTNKPGGR